MGTASTTRSPIILIIFIVFGAASVLFLSVLINYAKNPPSGTEVTSLPNISTFTSAPSLTATSTSTITLTPRPTFTLRPSATETNTPTSTFTNTPTLIKTITPATPAKLNVWYELKHWDLSEQMRLIELLQANAILTGSNDAYYTLAYGEGEALLRFPGASDASKWRWDRAFNLLRINDPQALPLYSKLINSSISSGQVQASDLPAWFSQNEKRLNLLISPLPPLPGELSRELIEIKTTEPLGSAYLWQVENPTGINIYPLVNDLRFDQPHENSYLYTDLNGDASPELAIFRITSPGTTMQLLPRIFDLSKNPPIELNIELHIPVDFGLESRLSIEKISSSSDTSSLHVINTLLPSCPTYATQSLTWNGELFTLSPLQYELVPVDGLEAECASIINPATSLWDPEAAIKVLSPLLDFWPPKLDTQGRPYPADAHDELLFRLGILYALDNDSATAMQYLNEIINSPSTPDSRWITPAENFLSAYQQPEDLYRACQQDQICNMQAALQTTVRLSGAEEPSQVLSYLQQRGVIIRSSGLLDFDKDGLDERWLIIEPRPESKLEFWILSRSNDGIEVVFVKVVEVGDSPPFFHQPEGSVPVIQFELHKGFIFHRLPQSGRAYIEWVDVEYARPKVILDGYLQAMYALMNSADPHEVQKTLLDLFNSPRFKGDCIAFNICDQFHYTLALVYDLNGEFGNAIDEYLWVWRNYGKSPFTTLARLKLDYFPLPTYTRTPVPSSTPIPTRTPTLTPTITYTPTITSTPTGTPTATVTPTPTSTP